MPEGVDSSRNSLHTAATMLRYRRIDLVLELSLLALLLLSVVGVLVVLVLDPIALVLLVTGGGLGGLVLGRVLRETPAGQWVLGALTATLATGLYAVYLLFDLSAEWAAGLAGLALLLFGTVLTRATLASGDDPHEP